MKPQLNKKLSTFYGPQRLNAMSATACLWSLLWETKFVHALSVFQLILSSQLCLGLERGLSLQVSRLHFNAFLIPAIHSLKILLEFWTMNSKKMNSLKNSVSCSDKNVLEFHDIPYFIVLVQHTKFVIKFMDPYKKMLELWSACLYHGEYRALCHEIRDVKLLGSLTLAYWKTKKIIIFG